ncbi:hypothetical protein TWF718_008550 [Orbilia javanica]|uniref:Uncharacterized protein n=1 Tax=Orbilia javanica TaxID=47235 RepID=A0AAN8NUF4_9PEZI
MYSVSTKFTYATRAPLGASCQLLYPTSLIALRDRDRRVDTNALSSPPDVTKYLPQATAKQVAVRESPETSPSVGNPLHPWFGRLGSGSWILRQHNFAGRGTGTGT